MQYKFSSFSAVVPATEKPRQLGSRINLEPIQIEAIRGVPVVSRVFPVSHLHDELFNRDAARGTPRRRRTGRPARGDGPLLVPLCPSCFCFVSTVPTINYDNMSAPCVHDSRRSTFNIQIAPQRRLAIFIVAFFSGLCAAGSLLLEWKCIGYESDRRTRFRWEWTPPNFHF